MQLKELTLVDIYFYVAKKAEEEKDHERLQKIKQWLKEVSEQNNLIN